MTARIVAVLIALMILVGAVFAPTDWLSEVTWLTYLIACIAWEMVGVLAERSWRQEPLTRIYRDRLMRLSKAGWFFRAAFLALFLWWILHWLVPMSGF